MAKARCISRSLLRDGLAFPLERVTWVGSGWSEVATSLQPQGEAVAAGTLPTTRLSHVIQTQQKPAKGLYIKDKDGQKDFDG